MLTTILVVRHADVFNPENVLYGRLPNFRLSDYGKYFAERTADFLAQHPITAFYTSPLLRARQTVRVLAARHPNVKVRPCSTLSEVRTSWQGTRYTEFPAGKTVYDLRREPTDETIDDIWRRMRSTLTMLQQRHTGETVVAVSHGDPIKILTLGLKGRALDGSAVREPDPARCSVTSFTFNSNSEQPEISYVDVVGLPEFRKVATLQDFAADSMRRVDLNGQDVLLVRSAGGDVFAVQNRCGHMRTCLHQGSLAGTVVTCPLHGAQFSVTNGAVVREPAPQPVYVSQFPEPGIELTSVDTHRLRSYEVAIRGDDIYLRPR